MSFGAQFKNDLNSIQIDDTTPCMSLIQKTRLTAGGAHELTYTGRTPLMALRAQGCAGAINGAGKDGSNFKWDITKFGTSGFVDCFIFDKPPPQPAGRGFGGELYDEQGSVVYSFAYPPMRIVGAGVGDYGSGRSYAFHQNRSGVGRGEPIYDLREIEDSRGNPTGAFEPVLVGHDKYPFGWECTSTGVRDVLPQEAINGVWIYPSVLLVLDVTNL